MRISELGSSPGCRPRHRRRGRQRPGPVAAVDLGHRCWLAVRMKSAPGVLGGERQGWRRWPRPARARWHGPGRCRQGWVVKKVRRGAPVYRLDPDRRPQFAARPWRAQQGPPPTGGCAFALLAWRAAFDSRLSRIWFRWARSIARGQRRGSASSLQLRLGGSRGTPRIGSRARGGQAQGLGHSLLAPAEGGTSRIMRSMRRALSLMMRTRRACMGAFSSQQLGGLEITADKGCGSRAPCCGGRPSAASLICCSWRWISRRSG